MTVQDELHELIGTLSAEEALRALEYLRRLSATRDETNRAIEEMIEEGGPVPPSTSIEAFQK
jgi:hypothetical protein